VCCTSNNSEGWPSPDPDLKLETESSLAKPKNEVAPPLSRLLRQGGPSADVALRTSQRDEPAPDLDLKVDDRKQFGQGPKRGCPTLVAPLRQGGPSSPCCTSHNSEGWASRHPHVGNCEKKIAAEELGHPPTRRWRIFPARPLSEYFQHPITGEQINLEVALPSGFSLHQ
jgi:hypothetical protein